MALSLLATQLSACPAANVDAGTPDDAGTTTDVVRYTPPWAFRPWISKDISDRVDTEEFVAGFVARDIPVGAVVLDSPWETQYNTFVPSPDRYGDFDELIDALHADDIRLVLWVTQMVNESSYDLEPGGDFYDGESPNFREGGRENYYVNDGETYFWWKGYGAAVDFFNDDATAWWHAQQDALLAKGLDGWKLDFGEQYITTTPVRTAAGEKTLQEYSEAYYKDFLDYGRKVRGPEFVTMVRGYDESYGFTPRFYARPEHAPVAWMGDNYQSYEGLEDALDHAFRSANAGYVVVGSDIGGYLDRKLDQEVPFSVDVFQRWTTAATYMPFFQLHGRANITPWTVPERADETVATYRTAASTHDALVPFFFSLAQETYASRRPGILIPIGGEADWPGDHRFLVGDAFLVAPILNASGARDVVIPPGIGRALPFPSMGTEPHASGATVANVSFPTSGEIPVYLLEGAIVPARPTNDATPFVLKSGHDVVMAWPSDTPSTFTRHDDDENTTSITAQRVNADVTVTMSHAPAPTVVMVPMQTGLGVVRINDATIERVTTLAALDAAEGVFFDAARSVEVIKVFALDDVIDIHIAGGAVGAN